MTLLLGPPGSGKSTLLLALAGKLDSGLKVSTWLRHLLNDFLLYFQMNLIYTIVQDLNFVSSYMAYCFILAFCPASVNLMIIIAWGWLGKEDVCNILLNPSFAIMVLKKNQSASEKNYWMKMTENRHLWSVLLWIFRFNTLVKVLILVCDMFLVTLIKAKRRLQGTRLDLALL